MQMLGSIACVHARLRKARPAGACKLQQRVYSTLRAALPAVKLLNKPWSSQPTPDDLAVMSSHHCTAHTLK